MTFLEVVASVFLVLAAGGVGYLCGYIEKKYSGGKLKAAFSLNEMKRDVN